MRRSGRAGVHNEISIAMQVMRRDKLNSFILPVLLQYVPEVNPELIQINYLDFSTSGLQGLPACWTGWKVRRSPSQRPGSGRNGSVAGRSGALGWSCERLKPAFYRATGSKLPCPPSLMRYVGTPAGRGVWDNFIKKQQTADAGTYAVGGATFAEPSEIQTEVGTAPSDQDRIRDVHASLHGR